MATIRDSKILKKKLLVNRFKKVVQETLRFSDGTIHDWVYMDMPNSTMIVAITPDQDVVTVKLYRHNLKQDVYELPAGLAEMDGEEVAVEAAGRELREETGYLASRMVYLGAYYALPSETNRWVHYYLALDAQKVEAPKLDNLIEQYFEMSIALVPFREFATTKSSGARRMVGMESLFGIKLAQEYLAQQVRSSERTIQHYQS